MVTLTDSAVEKVRSLTEDRGPEERALRIYVKPGGCSGFSYGLALDAPREGDRVFDVKGVQVVVDPESLELVDGSEIDYVDDITGQGFKIHNPNATSMCGCGASFRTATRAGQPGSCA
ncbi:heme biosynthesis protein HemY [Alicyclobacillus cellulosilyticus]|uniref:Heme biosynthesis protein HemY n=1 Tax=Alicyclobacillus cellulosilyticus TaxID=1003997 RepID=A0A917NFM3_9BACL|nr:iron-sulfur cluster assembly accessory protein [Alicyclobacillus cellulosilyticus]GGI97589.1 heme biosynthesis protein HemY [Alicyclobacillus cellulosilyticus]